MSERLSADGSFLGPYSPRDMILKGRKSRSRLLEYDLVWDITEMQVKTHVKAIFPNAVGPTTMQLAKPESVVTTYKRLGEARSVGLEKDIKISSEIGQTNEASAMVLQGNSDSHVTGGIAIPPDRDQHITPPRSTHDLDLSIPESSPELDGFLSSRQLIEDLASQHPHQRNQNQHHPTGETPKAQHSTQSSNVIIGAEVNPETARRAERCQEAGYVIQDGRRREGMWFTISAI